jgi:hypothetical protein
VQKFGSLRAEDPFSDAMEHILKKHKVWPFNEEELTAQ